MYPGRGLWRSRAGNANSKGVALRNTHHPPRTVRRMAADSLWSKLALVQRPALSQQPANLVPRRDEGSGHVRVVDHRIYASPVGLRHGLRNEPVV